MTGIQLCQHCDSRVVFKHDGTCPSCGVAFSQAPARALQPDTGLVNPYAAPQEMAASAYTAGRILSMVAGVFSLLICALFAVSSIASAILRPRPDIDPVPYLVGTVCGIVIMVLPPGFAGYCFLRYRWKAGLITMICFLGAFAALMCAVLMLAKPR